MKKIIIILLIFLLCGCKAKYTVCNISVTNNQLNYKLEGKYTIYYKKSFVTKIEKIEDYSSNYIDDIKYLEDSKKIELNNLQNMYGGYTYKVSRNRYNVNIKTDINVLELDIKKMLEDEYIDNHYINNNRITVGGIKLFYESRGAKCE